MCEIAYQALVIPTVEIHCFRLLRRFRIPASEGMTVIFTTLYLGRLQIAFFSVSKEHQEQGAKTRNSRLLQD
jgi:hypothetical protein